MSTHSFTINNTLQGFSIILDQISGQGGSDAPTILIPINFDLCPLGSGHASETIKFELLSIKAELSSTDKNFRCSETTQLYSYTINNKNLYSLQFPFQLNEGLITRIEKYRKGSLPFSISLQIQVGIYTDSFYGGQKDSRFFISSYETVRANASFKIEQSHWTNNILPNLGHSSYKLIELPLFNDIIPKEYSISIAELEQAQKYFINGDYDKTVSHCRAAIDPFYSNKVEFAKLKEFVKSKSEFEWANKVLNATEEWLDKIIKATASFSSKTHHAPSMGHFSRTEAEIVLMITTGIIAYIGKIEYKSE